MEAEHRMSRYYHEQGCTEGVSLHSSKNDENRKNINCISFDHNFLGRLQIAYGRFGMRHGCIVVCSWWHLLASATYRCLFFEPFDSIGDGAHRPLTTLCPPSPCGIPYIWDCMGGEAPYHLDCLQERGLAAVRWDGGTKI